MRTPCGGRLRFISPPPTPRRIPPHAAGMSDRGQRLRKRASSWDLAGCAGGSGGRAFAGREVVAAIRAVAVSHALGVGLAAFVVGRRIVVSAVATHVEIGPAAVAGVPEADALAGREHDGPAAREAAHGSEPAPTRGPGQRARPLDAAASSARSRGMLRACARHGRSRWRGCAGGCARAPTPPRWRRGSTRALAAARLRPGSPLGPSQAAVPTRARAGRRAGPPAQAQRLSAEPGLAASRLGLEGAPRARDRRGARAARRPGGRARWRRGSGAAPGGSSSASCWRRCSRARVDLRQLWSDPALALAERRRLARVARRDRAPRPRRGSRTRTIWRPTTCWCPAGEPAGCGWWISSARVCAGAWVCARGAACSRSSRARPLAVPAAQRLRFLRAYAGDRRRGAPLVGAAARRGAAARPARRHPNASSRDARRAPLPSASQRGAWRGFARRGADPGARARAPDRGAPPAAGGARVEVEAGILARGLPAPCAPVARAGCGPGRTRSRRAGSRRSRWRCSADRAAHAADRRAGRRRAPARRAGLRRRRTPRGGAAARRAGGALGELHAGLLPRGLRAGARGRRRACAPSSSPRTRSASAGAPAAAAAARVAARLLAALAAAAPPAFSSIARLPIGGGMGDTTGARPLFSSFADDPALAPTIEAFVLGLAERIDAAQDAYSRRDFKELGEPRRRPGQRRGGRRLRAARELRFGDRGDQPRPAAGADLSRARRAHRDRALRSPGTPRRRLSPADAASHRKNQRLEGRAVRRP